MPANKFEEEMEIHPTAEEMKTGKPIEKSLNCPMTFNTPKQQDILPCAKERCAWWVNRKDDKNYYDTSKISGCAILVLAVK